MKRTRIKTISKSLSKDRAAYRKAIPAFLKAHPICPVMKAWMGENYRTTQIHHAKGRAGELLNDQRYWVAVSSAGHALVEKYGKQARAIGFTVTKGYGLHDELEEKVVALRRKCNFTKVKQYDELIQAIHPSFVTE